MSEQSESADTGARIELVIDPRERSIGAATVRRVLPYARRRMVGPFIFLDIMGPELVPAGRRVDVDAHPHIGLATLTYLFDGSLVHRDSTGAVQTIVPGDVNWMTAGNGVTHTERSRPEDVDVDMLLRGVQIWIALPTEFEDVDPSFAHVPASDLPAFRQGGAAVRLVAGTAWGREAPTPVYSPLVLADLALDGSEPALLDAEHEERAVLAMEGEVTVDGQPLESGQLAVLAPDRVVSVHGWGRALLLGGAPVGARSIWWNFVHSDPNMIEEAKKRWAAGAFPTVPGDHENPVPLPPG